MSALSSLLRIPLTISAVGVPAYGVIGTIGSIFTWVAMIPTGARQAASSAVAMESAEDPHPIVREVTRATVRYALPVASVAIVAVAVTPISVVVDPQHSMSALDLKLALIGCIAVGLLSISGSSLLGAKTTLGDFRAQNVAIVASVVAVTAATMLAKVLALPAAVFALIWCCALAGPALVALGRPHRVRPRSPLAHKYRSLSATSVWMTLGQQVASGFDLIIVTVMLGSASAAEYALWTRLVLIATTPSIGAAPVLTRLAGSVRTQASPESRSACHRAFYLVLIVQLVVVVALGLAAHLAMTVLSAGKIQVSTGLLVAGLLWTTFESTRRALVAATTTTRGLTIWKTIGLSLAVPNVVLSVVLTKLVGVSGPALASVIAFAVSIAWAVVAMRQEIREVAG